MAEPAGKEQYLVIGADSPIDLNGLVDTRGEGETRTENSLEKLIS